MYPNQDYQFDGSSVTEYPLPEAGSGYKVVRSSERKGKTHKVTGPDGTVKFFGDSKLGQHPKDPARKKAFYARHKKNLAGNPYFRAFARKTWEEGGELNDWEILDTAQDGRSLTSSELASRFRPEDAYQRSPIKFENIGNKSYGFGIRPNNFNISGALDLQNKENPTFRTALGYNKNGLNINIAPSFSKDKKEAIFTAGYNGRDWSGNLMYQDPSKFNLGFGYNKAGFSGNANYERQGKNNVFNTSIGYEGEDVPINAGLDYTYDNGHSASANLGFNAKNIRGGFNYDYDQSEKANRFGLNLGTNFGKNKKWAFDTSANFDTDKNYKINTGLKYNFKSGGMLPDLAAMAFGGNLILEKYQDGGSNWEILPEAQVGTKMGIISDPRKDAYYTQPANSNQNIQQEILKQQTINNKGSENNPIQKPEVEIVAKKQLDPSKKAFWTVYPDKTGSSAELASALFLAPIAEWAHTPSRVINYGIGAYKNKDLTFNPYQSEITKTLDLETDPNNLWHSVRNFAINNAADFVAPMTPKLGNWSKELVKGSIKAGRPKLPEFQTVLRAEASGFNPSKVSPSPSLNPVQQGYTGQWLQTASKKNPGAFDEVAAYLTGLETKSGGKMQLLSDVVPWSEAQKFTGKNLPFNAKTMSFGAGEFGTLENAFKQGVITKRELALLQNYNSQAARIGSSPNLNKAMNETISKLRQNPKTYNANEMLNASLASRLRLAPTSVGSPELLSKELEAIKNQAMKGYLYAPAVEAAKKGITKKTVLEQVKPEDKAQSGGRINSEWEIMQEGGNVWEIVSDNEWEII
jgi:hypothetical protein